MADLKNYSITNNANNNAKTISPNIYLPGLNGLRAIAALGVVISHITIGLADFGLDNKIFGVDMYGHSRGWDLAGSGVSIFFTLSGFLITFLFLKEKELGEVKIKNFYIRRLLRIWPLYYLYFIISILTLAVFSIAYQKDFIAFYILLAANIPFVINGGIPFLSHYWSLGVEEQFYLFFPHLAKLKNKILLKNSGIIFIIFMVVKALFWILSKKYAITTPLLVLTVCRFDIMLIGVIGAILYYNNNKTFLDVATHKITQFISWAFIVLIAMNRTNFFTVIHEELVGVVSVFLIIGQITRRNFIINLENKFCNFIGRISYGIYVIHPLLIFYFSKIIGHYNAPSPFYYILTYMIILSATILIAYISYEFYEKRFIKLKLNYTTIKSSNKISSP